jgi:hypothetical protein
MGIQIRHEVGTSLECLISYYCWWRWEMTKQEQRAIAKIWCCIRERIPLICVTRNRIKIYGNTDPDGYHLLQKEEIAMWMSQSRHITHVDVTFILLHYIWTLHISGKLHWGLIVGINCCEGDCILRRSMTQDSKDQFFQYIGLHTVQFLKVTQT